MSGVLKKYIYLYYKIKTMYSDSDYNCPYCGWEMDYNHPKLRCEDYGYICPECGEHFETPDV